MIEKKGKIKSFLNLFKTKKDRCCGGFEIQESKKEDNNRNNCCCNPNPKKVHDIDKSK